MGFACMSKQDKIIPMKTSFRYKFSHFHANHAKSLSLIAKVLQDSFWNRGTRELGTGLLQCPLDHFTVLCSVTWPLNDSEAGSDFALTQTSLSCKCTLLALDQLYLHSKSNEVFIKTSSPPASLSGHWPDKYRMAYSVQETKDFSLIFKNIPSCDQNLNSFYKMNILSCRQVIRKKNIINQVILSWCNTKFSKKCTRICKEN